MAEMLRPSPVVFDNPADERLHRKHRFTQMLGKLLHRGTPGLAQREE